MASHFAVNNTNAGQDDWNIHITGQVASNYLTSNLALLQLFDSCCSELLSCNLSLLYAVTITLCVVCTERARF